MRLLRGSWPSNPDPRSLNSALRTLGRDNGTLTISTTQTTSNDRPSSKSGPLHQELIRPVPRYMSGARLGCPSEVVHALSSVFARTRTSCRDRADRGQKRLGLFRPVLSCPVLPSLVPSCPVQSCSGHAVVRSFAPRSSVICNHTKQSPEGDMYWTSGAYGGGGGCKR